MNSRQHHMTADRDCDNAPIQFSGAIQPHGYLIACSMPGWIVRHVSVNVAGFLGMPVASMLGKSLDTLLPEELMHSLGNAATTVMMEPGSQQRIAEGQLGTQRVRCDVCVYRSGALLHIEIEPNEANPLRGHDPLALAQGMITRLAGTTGLDEFHDRAVQQVRAMTGFDRVMIYRFLHDGSGKVIAESRRSGMESYLGLHYPASDIPQPARELYRRNRLRCIEDANYTPVPIEPRVDEQGRPLDLSQTGLRSVAPVHLEYLRNMGVGASMSVSVMCNGRLWGLIACHHRSARRVPMDMRSAADLFGMFFSMQVAVREDARDRDYEIRARVLHEELIHALGRDANPADALARRLGMLRRMVPCDGVGAWIAGRWLGEGSTPPAAALPALVEALAAKGTREVIATHALSSLLPEASAWAERCSGVMALPVSTTPGDYLLLFRRELPRSITWAGDPNTPFQTDPETGKLSPRRSFEAWKQEVRGQSAAWSHAELRVGERLRVALLEHVLRSAEANSEQQRISSERQGLLVAELNHRVKNLLALMQSLVMSSHDSAENLHEFVENLEGRIRALAFAHDQITPRSNNEARLRALVESELMPYRQGQRRIEIEGPPVVLDNRSGPALALVLHEMTTNAVKYGALSVDTGHLRVAWRVDEEKCCHIEWTERGGPEVQPPHHEGFGSTLIRRSIPFELRGEVKVDYLPEGVHAVFSLPGDHLRVDTVDDRATEAIKAPSGGLAGQPTVLLVEDNMLIALDTEHVLQRLGAAQVEVAGNVVDALEILSHVSVDAAVLDVNLGDETSLAIADALHSRGTPFVFATGYHDRAMIPRNHAGVPVIRKPFTPDSLSESLRLAIGARPPDAGDGPHVAPGSDAVN
ncbi:HWE histidine kinase domain-containing protein [Alkalisalibacterium limincola]|uniref:histidine kinase n=1 Tax=Alkalisalibacterium limincola TaxID=2699169 RepID=A0A5C8KSM0_9GAMM|nr:HWE histidine kinase domain-containing protein [Alkalisalibacterium limincola]TXK62322.1 GAF domain-containing protein [Alkalisalibacterium limincola]